MSAPAEDAPEQGRTAGTFRLVLLGVLVLALLASAGVLVWLLADRRGEADQLQSDREAVMSRTDQFVLRLNTFGPDDVDSQGKLSDYQQQVEDVITSKFATAFESDGLPLAQQLVSTAGYARSAKILGTGVESVSDDTASVIVAATLDTTYPNPKHPDDASKRLRGDTDVLRWVVKLVNEGGSWLVDSYTTVTAAGESQ